MPVPGAQADQPERLGRNTSSNPGAFWPAPTGHRSTSPSKSTNPFLSASKAAPTASAPAAMPDRGLRPSSQRALPGLAVPALQPFHHGENGPAHHWHSAHADDNLARSGTIEFRRVHDVGGLGKALRAQRQGGIQGAIYGPRHPNTADEGPSTHRHRRQDRRMSSWRPWPPVRQRSRASATATWSALHRMKSFRCRRVSGQPRNLSV